MQTGPFDLVAFTIQILGMDLNIGFNYTRYAFCRGMGVWKQAAGVDA